MLGKFARLKFRLIAICSLLVFVLIGCSEQTKQPPVPEPTAVAAVVTSAATSTPTTTVEVISAETTPLPQPTATPLPEPSPTPYIVQNPSAPCGQLLPLIVDSPPTTYEWQVPPLPEEFLPWDVIPALDYFFENPEDTAIVAWQIGYEGIGFYHNPDQLMPLASVSKLVNLAAYAAAIDSGQLDPDQPVDLEELEAFYLPGSDLGAFARSLREVGEEALTLDDVMLMMTRFSDNASADFIHYLLGQTTIEQTALDLGMTSQTAICPFLSRLLMMGNHTSPTNNRATMSALADAPTEWGEQATYLTDRYLEDDAFRTDAQRYWLRRRQPAIEDQAHFIQTLETRGTAREYAVLMAKIARGEVGSPTTNALIREHLDWPIEEFALNAERYTDVGYKNGTFPGMLNSVYFATSAETNRTTVVAVFFNKLPNRTYQNWRRILPHDAMAHWLLSDPEAIHKMHVFRDSASQP